MKKVRICFIMLTCLIVFNGCVSKHINIGTAAAKFPSDGLQAKYNSPYTVCYKNKDGSYSFFIFSSPIQYKGKDNMFHFIDNSIVQSSYQNYDYENKENNIKTYFSKNGICIRSNEDAQFLLNFIDESNFILKLNENYVNSYGDSVSAVVYQSEAIDYVVYPVNMGIKCEMILKSREALKTDIGFCLKGSFDSFLNNVFEYTTFEQESQIKSIFHYPTVMLGQELRYDLQCLVDIKEVDKGCNINFTLPSTVFDQAKNDSIKLDMSFVLYHSNMPDVGVYSKMNRNSYLSQKAFVGSTPSLGEGVYLSRLRLNYFTTIKPEQILGASMNIKALQNPSFFSNVELYNVKEQWSSTQLLWGQTPAYGQQVGKASAITKNSYLNVEISDYVKRCFEDPAGTQESLGVLLKAKEQSGGYGVLATSDNAAYPSFIKIDVKKLPAYFKARDAMNEQMY